MKSFQTFPNDIKKLSPTISNLKEWNNWSWQLEDIGQYIICNEIANQILTNWKANQSEFISVLNLIEEYLVSGDAKIQHPIYTDFIATIVLSENQNKDEIIKH
jgi:hypothetical protein